MSSSRETLNVYVPAEESELRDEIWPSSAIVGSEVSDTGRLRIDFEGDGVLYPSFREQLRRASERHTCEGPGGKQGYPTRACAYVDPEEVRQVGRYDPETNELEVNREGLLERWRKRMSAREG